MKELIEESDERAKAAWTPDLKDYYKNVSKALQDQQAEINRLKAERDIINKDRERFSNLIQKLEAKLSEQVDPIELIDYVLRLALVEPWEYDRTFLLNNPKELLAQFKKEKEL